MEMVEKDQSSITIRKLVNETEAMLKDHAYSKNVSHLKNILENSDDIQAYRTRPGWFYDLYRDANHPRGIWRRIPDSEPIDRDGSWETVFDIDAYAAETGKDWIWRGPIDSPNGRRVLLVLSLGGSDKIQAREFYLQTLQFVSGGFETSITRQFLAWGGRG